jgi:exopolysaccharide biosynthesis polyprenyl glycosylphosphotransferase
VALYLASTAAMMAAPALSIMAGSGWMATLFALLVFAMLHARSGPEDRLECSMLDTVVHIVGVVSLGAMLVIAADSIVGGYHPVALALRLWLFTAVYLVGVHIVLLSARRLAVRSEALATPTLIIGAGVIGERLAKRLADEPRYGLRPVGFLDADPLLTAKARSWPAVPVLGGPADLSDALGQTQAKHVLIAFTSEPDHVLVDLVQRCQERGVTVSLVPRLYESINGRATLDRVGGLALVTLRATDPRGWSFAIKHAFDRLFALLALVVLSPLMLTIAVAVRLTSGGPVLFRQRRVGRDGHVFYLLKFRTMRVGESGHFSPPAGCAPGGVEGGDRRTSIGRFLRDHCLDEIPQFYNVLRGDMSLVGPRPERPEFVRRFSAEVAHYDDRHRVKSGITGWAQVYGLRGQTSIDDRVEWDNYYIQNWSLKLDLRILALTMLEVLRLRANGKPE